MKVIILAAGYGTRLQSVIGDRPKALVDIGGKTVLDRLMERLVSICSARDITLVSNARYFKYFEDWKLQQASRITLLDDGSTEAGNRLGAIGDIRFVVREQAISDDILVMAADNILTFELDELVSAQDHPASARVGIWYNEDLEDQRRRGVVSLGEGDRLTAFSEKPSKAESHWAAAPLYYLPANLLPVIDDYLAAGGNPDAPGYLMEYLVAHHAVYGWRMPARMLDVGNPESLALTRARFAQ